MKRYSFHDLYYLYHIMLTGEESFVLLGEVQALVRECLPLVEEMIQLDAGCSCLKCAAKQTEALRDKLKAIIEAKP